MNNFLDIIRGAFVCGSRMHGTPHSASDVDICILVTPEEAKILGDNADVPNDLRQGWGSFPVKYGKLNIIVCVEEETYLNWKSAVTALIEEKPITKERAIEVCRSFGVSK